MDVSQPLAWGKLKHPFFGPPFLLLVRLCLFLGFFHLQHQAQTGPGGVGATATNIIWLSADSGVYTDAGVTLAANNNLVEEWHDRSGNGNDVTETTASDQPTYLTNIVNGFPALRFNGSLSRLLATGVASSNQVSLWVVAQYASLPSPNPGLIHAAPAGSAFSTSGSNKTLGMWVNTTNSRVWGRGVQSNNSSRSISQVTALSASTFFSILNDYNGTTIQQYVNNTAAGSVTYDGTLASWSDFGVGRQGSESWNGDISEVIVFNFSVNTAQRIIVENYLAAKYNFTLTSNDLYTMDNGGNGDYDYEVAGIGRVDASNIHNDSQAGIVRISKSTFGGLGNNEFLILGHNNGPLTSIGFTDVPTGVVSRLGRIWRVSERNTAGTSSVNVGRTFLDFDLSGLNVTAAADVRLLIDGDGDGDFSDATAFSITTDLGGDVYRFNLTGGNLRNSRTFTVATASATPLPIELASFEAAAKGDVVEITWSTASETNNDFFTVQRSADGQEFEDLLEIPGAGDSNETLFYDTLDRQPLAGRSFYRLKQTDFDGTFSYSWIESVFRSISQESFSVFPIPATSYVEIRSQAQEAGITNISLCDAQGKEYLRTTLNYTSGTQVHPLILPKLARGVYFVKFQGSSSSVVPLIIE